MQAITGLMSLNILHLLYASQKPQGHTHIRHTRTECLALGKGLVSSSDLWNGQIITVHYCVGKCFNKHQVLRQILRQSKIIYFYLVFICTSCFDHAGRKHCATRCQRNVFHLVLFYSKCNFIAIFNVSGHPV